MFDDYWQHFETVSQQFSAGALVVVTFFSVIISGVLARLAYWNGQVSKELAKESEGARKAEHTTAQAERLARAARQP